MDHLHSSHFSIDALMRPEIKPPSGRVEQATEFDFEPGPDLPPTKRLKIDTENHDFDESVTTPDDDTNDDPSSSATAMAALAVPLGDSSSLSNVQCRLEARELWSKFHALGTEMIITKSGRRMFPTLRFAFTGLDPMFRYTVLVDVIPLDSKRYRYAYHRSSWLVAGKADPPLPPRLYIHPDGPFTGAQLAKQVLSFEKLKLTNNEMDKNAHIVLNSMHKYQPRIHIVRLSETETSEPTVTDIVTRHYKTYVFPETQFTAVTAYQNQLITKLKIDSNPFAKGFRDSTRLTDFESYCREHIPSTYPDHMLLNRIAAALYPNMLTEQTALMHPGLMAMSPWLQAAANARFAAPTTNPFQTQSWFSRFMRPTMTMPSMGQISSLGFATGSMPTEESVTSSMTSSTALPNSSSPSAELLNSANSSAKNSPSPGPQTGEPTDTE